MSIDDWLETAVDIDGVRFVPAPKINQIFFLRFFDTVLLGRSTHDWRQVMDKSKRWSQKVTESSDALDLEQGVFSLEDPREIALSLKKSAEQSKRRKSDPYRSAMSMLTFYINRAGKQLTPEHKDRLEAAKDELRALFGRPRRKQ